MSAKGYRYITPLEEKPEVRRKRIGKSFSQKAVEEFHNSNEQYASVKLPNDKSTTAYARAIGRTIKKLGLSDYISVYSSSSEVYLEKKK